jgi:hypothetical protein
MRRLALLLMVAAGIGVGHTATYALFPHHGDSHALAHAYPQQFASGAGIALLGLLLWSALQHARGHEPHVSARTVVLWQVGGFAALELGERLVSSGITLQEPALWVGLVLQAAVALVLRYGFVLLPRMVVAAFTGRPRAVRLPGRILSAMPRACAPARSSLVAGAAGPRAPPAGSSI